VKPAPFYFYKLIIEEDQQAVIPKIVPVESSIYPLGNLIATRKDERALLAKVLPNETVNTDKDVTKDFVGFLQHIGERPYDLKDKEALKEEKDKIVTRSLETAGAKSIEDEKEFDPEDIPSSAQAWVYLLKVPDEGVDKVVTLEENQFNAVARDLIAKYKVRMTQVGSFKEHSDVTSVKMANKNTVVEYIKVGVDMVLTNEKSIILQEKIIAPKDAIVMDEDIPFSIKS
jgi:hypothetical protein